MKQLLLIAALSLGISVTGASAQLTINIADVAKLTTVNTLEENLIQVHKKHKKFKKYKQYSRKHNRKHNRNSDYAYKHHRHYGHRHKRYYGPAYGLYGSIVLGNGAVVIRLY